MTDLPGTPLWGPEPPVLDIGGLWLTVPRAGDDYALLDIESDPETAAWFGYAPWHARLEGCQDDIARAVRGWQTGERAVFAVRERPDGTLIGTVEAKLSRGRVELTWRTHPASRGRRVATRAARALIAWCIARGAESLWASIDLDNGASLAVARNVGMVEHDRDGRWVHLVADAAARVAHGDDPEDGPRAVYFATTLR